MFPQGAHSSVGEKNTYTLFIKGYAEHKREREKVGWRESSDDNKGVTSNVATESEDHEIR